MSRVSVVTGSNKGIGLDIVKGLCEKFDGVVYLTSRNEKRGKEAVEKLIKLGLNPKYHQLDVSNRNSVMKFRDFIQNEHGGLDVLINNAAIADSTSVDTSYEECVKIIDNNYKGVLTMRELIYPLVRDNGRILNISSDCGHLSNIRNKHWIDRLSKDNSTVEDVNDFVNWFLESKKNDTFNPEDIADGATIAAYRISKVALSAVTMVHQRELAGRNIAINSMHPGLVRTDMTNSIGFYSADQAAETPLYIVLHAPQSLQGAYVWYNGKVLDWFDYKADYFFKYKTVSG